MYNETEALLFDEGSGGRPTGVEVSSTPGGAGVEASETKPANKRAGDDRRRHVGRPGRIDARIGDRARDLRVLLGDPGRDAAEMWTPARVRIGSGLHRRVRDGKGGPDEGPDRHDVSRTPYPRIATLKTAAAFRNHLERSGIPLEFDDELTPARGDRRSPSRSSIDGCPGRQPLLHPADGRVGRHDRRANRAI